MVCLVYVLVFLWVVKVNRASAAVRIVRRVVIELRVRVIEITAGVRVHVSMDGVMVSKVGEAWGPLMSVWRAKVV